ncbi:MAG: hypothetical protein EHM93_12135 [Bacteroidales bacterium]|nr:MAG: hypothetical protein EHM93_12135 [Bacteroidales bacterium]
MIIHILGTENFYQKSFINLIERNFAPDSHRFIFRSTKVKKENYRSTTAIGIKRNVISLIFFIPQLLKAEKIFIHYLPHGPSLIFWTIYSFFSKKLVWVYWGGDIYIYKDKNRTIKSQFYELCRRFLIKNLRNIAGFLYGDFKIIKEVYQTQAVYTQIIYPLPIDLLLLERISAENKIEKSDNKTRILAGNSADPSNNHIELFSFLERFRDEDIEIICPLSYGPNKDYIELVKKEGERIFGVKFKPLLEFLTPSEYSKILIGVDITIMNHQRQQGLGNLVTILWLGKKVFVRSDTTSYAYFNSEKIKVWDTIDIQNLPFDDFKSMNPADGIKNKTLALNVFSENHYVELWSNVFNVSST